jgi:hypothetical protein
MYSPLEIVQSILSDMGASSVNAIGDTELSEQVANVMRHTYYQVMLEAPAHYRQSFASVSAPYDIPTKLKLDGAAYGDITNIAYNYKGAWRVIERVSPSDFISLTMLRDAEGSIDVRDGSLTYRIYEDKPPRYATSFSADTLVLDAYDKTYSTTISAAHLMLGVEKVDRLDVTSEKPLTIPAELVMLVMSKTAAACFELFKKEQNPSARINEARMRRKVFRSQGTNTTPNKPRTFGRK